MYVRLPAWPATAYKSGQVLNRDVVMPIFSVFAIYFIIWWMTLFIVLPIGLRTQADESDVVPGSVESAPARFRALRIFGLTTILAAVIHIVWYVLSVRYGYGIDAIPQFAPKFY
ncbi:Predicted secreted protein [Rhizobium sp. 9140]|nr:Predicted secreted protein [Rhizobium sp. 9140]